MYLRPMINLAQKEIIGFPELDEFRTEAELSRDEFGDFDYDQRSLSAGFLFLAKGSGDSYHEEDV